MKKLFAVLAMLVAMNASGQWIQKNNGMESQSIFAIAGIGSSLFAASHSAIFLSTNNGENWTSKLSSSNSFSSLLIKGQYIFAGSIGGGIQVSTNNGETWTPSNNGLSNLIVRALISKAGIIYAGTFDGVFISSNNGVSWSQSSLINKDIRSFVADENNIYAGVWGNGVYMSTDNGLNWVQKGLSDKNVLSLAVAVNKLYAGTMGSGVYLSTNNGTTWSHTSFSYEDANSLLAIEINVLSGGSFYPSSFTGICLTTNSGINWTKINEGFSYVPSINSLYLKNEYIFAGTDGYSVWRRPIWELVHVPNISTEVPMQFSLEQNYPNPFNPTTFIHFAIFSEGSIRTASVKILIYDYLGREVQTFVDEKFVQGTYQRTFDGTGFPSGVYFYKLIVNGESETKRMLLLK